MTSDSDQIDDAVFRNASWKTVTRVGICYTKLFDTGSVSLSIVEQGAMLKTNRLIAEGQRNRPRITAYHTGC